MMKKNRLFKDKLDIVIAMVLTGIFVCFFVFFPMQEYGDSFQYLHHMIARDPIYSLILVILQSVSERYDMILSFIQNTLAIICIYWTYKRFSEVFEFAFIGRILCAVALLLPHIITPFASNAHMILTCSLLTEGISLSIYYVWFGIILSVIAGYYGEKDASPWIALLILSVVLSMIRGQFVLCFFIGMAAMIYALLKRKQYRRIALYILSCIIAFVVKDQLTKVYHYTFNGVYTSTVSSAPMLLSNIIYVTGEEDIDALTDGWVREAASAMYKEAEKEGLTIGYAPGGIIERARFHEKGHETINFDIVTEQIDELVYRFDGIDETDYMYFLYRRDIYADPIIKQLLPLTAGKYFANIFNISTLGFIRSVAVDRSVLSVYAVFVYMLSFILTLILLRRDKSDKAAVSMVFVLLLICGTVFGTSLMIECISRYMIYNLPLFYMVLMAEVKSITSKSKYDIL